MSIFTSKAPLISERIEGSFYVLLASLPQDGLADSGVAADARDAKDRESDRVACQLRVEVEAPGRWPGGGAGVARSPESEGCSRS